MMKFLVALLLVGAVFSVNSVDHSHAAPVAAAPAAPAAPAVAHSANDGHGHDAHAANDGHGDAAHAAPVAHDAHDAHAADDGHGDAAHAAPVADAHAAPAAAAHAAPVAHAANDGHNSHFAPDPHADVLPPVIPPTPVAAESTASTDAKAAAVASVTVESNTPPAPAAPEPAPVAEKLPAVVGSFVPLFCYQNEELKDRIYTTNAQELGRGKENWKTCGTVGLVAGEEIEGFAQLLRYVDLNGMKHEYSSKPLIETDEVRSEGYEGYVSEQPREGMVALSSYLDKATGERLLSVESSHPASYEQQEVLGYIKPVPSEMVPVPEPTAESTAAAASGDAAHAITAAPEETKFWADHPSDARLQPLFRYWNAALQDHYYTMDYSVLGAGKNGWRYQGIQAYIYPTKVEDTVPLYRYFNLRAGDHFYTTDFYDMGEGKDGYKFSGVTGYVRDAPSKATVPLYRYYNAKIADHFYTTNSMSQAAGTDEWANEGVAAYVYPVPDPAQHENASEYALLVPLYRYWNARYGDHFYTTIWKEVDAGTHGWEYQGVQALVYAKQEPGTVPLYRYWNVQTLDHFYTTNFEALGQGGKDGWKYEGVTAFVDIYRKPGTEPLYRYFNNKLNDHLYVTRWLGRETKGYVYEGIQCYVHRKPLDATDAGRVKAPEGFASLYRYWSASAKDHLYTTNFDELGAGSQGYVLEGVEGFCGKDSESGLTALHRYYNPRVKDTFLTTDFKILKSGGKDGWEYQGVTCYIAATSRPGFVKLNRYYSKINKDHFFTSAFVGQVQASYVFQGITGFIKPYVAAVIGAGNVANTGVVSQEIQANSVELHSYYNAQTKDHFLTTNFDVLGAGKAGWEYRGILARILSTEMANTRKLRQYYSPSRKDHRYTIRHLRGGDWRYEGIVGYIFDEQVPGSTAIMNFENRAAMDNALSLLSAGPRTGGVYDFIETLGYVLPPK